MSAVDVNAALMDHKSRKVNLSTSREPSPRAPLPDLHPPCMLALDSCSCFGRPAKTKQAAQQQRTAKPDSSVSPVVLYRYFLCGLLCEEDLRVSHLHL
ncbi:unnamed protein product [Arctogadus glacialis]